MKKEITWQNSLTLWWIVGVVLMFIVGMGRDIIWDEFDWIFLFLFIGIIVLNVKLNKLLGK